MSSESRAFRMSRTTAARLSLVLSLGLTGAATIVAAPALSAQSSARTDLAIQSDVLKALSAYPDISNEHITATTENGTVTLAGTASSDTAKSQAQVVAATVDGVRSVVNNVTVDAAAAGQTTAQNESVQNESQEPETQQQPVQQAQSTTPDQPAYPQQSQPQPGASGNWGKAGPPPDISNGQIPQPPNESQQGSGAQQQASQYPMQDPGEDGPAPAQQPAPGAQRPPYNGAGNPYPQQQYPRQNAQPPAYPRAQMPSGPVTIPPGTLFTVRTSEPLDSRRLQGGENFQVVLAQDIYSGPYLAIPRGAVLQGHVAGVKKPGAFRGGAGFALQIVSLNLTGQTYPVTTDTFATDTGGKGGYTTANTVGGAAIGALIGAVAGGGPGAAIGAVAGGGVGLGASAATYGPREIMPPETALSFHLRTPLTVSPVSYAEAQRLQASVAPPQGPRRVMRPAYGYPYGYPPPPPPPPYYYGGYYPYRCWR